MGASLTTVVMQSTTKITQSVMNNFVTNNQNVTYMSMSAEQINNIQLEGVKYNCTGNFIVSNDFVANGKIIASFTNVNETSLQTQLTSEITQELTQQVSQQLGFLGGLGNFSDTDVRTQIQAVVDQSVKNNVTINNLNSFVQQTYAKQGNSLVFKNSEFNIQGDCVFTNKVAIDLQINAVVQNISKNIAESIMKSAVAQKASQSYSYKAAGVEDVVKAATSWVIAIVIGVVVVVGGGGVMVAKNVTDPKKIAGFAVAVLLLIGLYFLLAFIFKWPPFSAKQSASAKEYWGCQIDPATNLFTGQCERKTNAIDGPFENKQLCDDAQRKDIPFCSNFYGCDYDTLERTGESKCIPGNDPKYFPYASKSLCESSTTRCDPFYEGNPSYQTSFNPYVDQCKELKNPRKPVNKDSKLFQEKKDCCKQYNCPPPGPLSWADVKSRKQNESDIDWARRIYDMMLQAPPGTRSPPGLGANEGGVTTNAALLTGKNTIDKSLADSLCQNPCQWYYDKNVPVPMCNCAVKPRVSNFV